MTERTSRPANSPTGLNNIPVSLEDYCNMQEINDSQDARKRYATQGLLHKVQPCLPSLQVVGDFR